MTVHANFNPVAKAFVEARRNSHVVASYPGTMPANFDEAYDIQDEAIHLVGQAVGGRKVGRVPDALVPQYGVNRLAGPIFASSIVDAADGSSPNMPLLEGFAAAEAELMLRIGAVPPATVTLETMPDYIDDVRFGLEIASSPFPGINDHGPAVTVSDFGNNFGLVLGPRIENWKTRNLMDAPVRLDIDGQNIGNGKLANMLDGPFGSAVFLTKLLAARGKELAVGTWISTGAITGVHKIVAGQSSEAVFDNEYRVSCVTHAFKPALCSAVGDK